jgi:hypothetical protein
MSGRLFGKGRQAYSDLGEAWLTHTQKAMLVDMTVAATFIKQITAASAAGVITSAAHGFAVGDIVVIALIVGNVTCNGTWRISAVTTNTFTIQTLEQVAVSGGAAYVSGGSAINITQAQFVAGVSSGREGTDVALTGNTNTDGVLNASAWTWLGVPIGNAVQGVVIYDSNGGSDATNKLGIWIDGAIRVVVNTAALALATTILVEPLKGALANGTVLNFSDGSTKVLSAPAAQGDRSITVTAQATAVTIGATADAQVASSGFPLTPNGGNISFTPGTLYAPGNPTGLAQL